MGTNSKPLPSFSISSHYFLWTINTIISTIDYCNYNKQPLIDFKGSPLKQITEVNSLTLSHAHKHIILSLYFVNHLNLEHIGNNSKVLFIMLYKKLYVTRSYTILMKTFTINSQKIITLSIDNFLFHVLCIVDMPKLTFKLLS